MHSGNIGVVFGPTLMRPGGDTSALTDIAESGTKSYCIEFMVRNCQLLFEKDEVIVSPVQVEKIYCRVPVFHAENEYPSDDFLFYASLPMLPEYH